MGCRNEEFNGLGHYSHGRLEYERGGSCEPALGARLILEIVHKLTCCKLSQEDVDYS